jgi:hypothetical protein
MIVMIGAIIEVKIVYMNTMYNIQYIKYTLDIVVEPIHSLSHS